ERHRLAGGRWRTVVTVERKGDGRVPVEIGDRDTIYARATGEPVTERVEFTSARKPGRLMLDPRGRTHDYDMLNNRERRVFVGRGAVDLRLDDPTRERARRHKLVSAWLPVAWSNDFGGVTLAVRNRTNYLDRYNRGLSVATAACGRMRGRSKRAPGSPRPCNAGPRSCGRGSPPVGGSCTRTPAPGTRPRAVTTSRASAASRARRACGRRSPSARPSACDCSAARTPAARPPCRSAAYPSPAPTPTSRSRIPCSAVRARCSCARTRTITRPATATCSASGTTWAAAGPSP